MLMTIAMVCLLWYQFSSLLFTQDHIVQSSHDRNTLTIARENQAKDKSYSEAKNKYLVCADEHLCALGALTPKAAISKRQRRVRDITLLMTQMSSKITVFD